MLQLQKWLPLLVPRSFRITLFLVLSSVLKDKQKQPPISGPWLSIHMDVFTAPVFPFDWLPPLLMSGDVSLLLCCAPAGSRRQREAEALMGSRLMVSVAKIANTITGALKKRTGGRGLLLGMWVRRGWGVGGGGVDVVAEGGQGRGRYITNGFLKRLQRVASPS